MSKKITIYQFWFGDEIKKNSLKKNIDSFNKKSNKFEIILGPTDDEHEFLLDDNPNYKKFIETNKFVFASDIYRFWICSQYNNIIYMDSTVEFDENKLFLLYKRCYAENKNFFVFESYNILWSGFFINMNFSYIFTECYEYTKTNKIFTSPLVITEKLRENNFLTDIHKYNFDAMICKYIDFLSIKSECDVIKINPLGSWRKKDVKKIWNKKEKNFFKTKNRDNLYFKLPVLLRKIIIKLI